MPERPNILVVCGRNKRRSRTAEHLFKNDSRFAIRSAGLSPQSNRKLSEKDVLWADLILVMENIHRARIREEYRALALPPLEVLEIEDEYEFMAPELIQLLTERMNGILNLK
jgi:Predicted protein tyrosine phosphatase